MAAEQQQQRRKFDQEKLLTPIGCRREGRRTDRRAHKLAARQPAIGQAISTKLPRILPGRYESFSMLPVPLGGRPETGSEHWNDVAAMGGERLAKEVKLLAISTPDNLAGKPMRSVSWTDGRTDGLQSVSCLLSPRV